MHGSTPRAALSARLRRIATVTASALVVALLVPVSAAGEAAAEDGAAGTPLTPTQTGVPSVSTGLVPRVDDLTVDRTALDYEHPTLTAHGRVRLYDPATQTYRAASSGIVALSFGNSGPTATVDQDGWFTSQIEYRLYVPSEGVAGVTLYWQPDASTKAAYGDRWLPSVATWDVSVTASSWRLVLDETTATVREPDDLTFGGVVSRWVDGAWRPAAGARVNTSDGGVDLTDAEGRFTVTTSPSSDGNWPAHLNHAGAFLRAGVEVSASIKVDLIPTSTIVWTRHTVDPYGRADLRGRLVYDSAPDARVPLYIQESGDGKTGWHTIGKVTTGTNPTTHLAQSFVTFPELPHRHWYHRVVFKGTAAVQPSISPVWRSTRMRTRIANFTVGPRTVDFPDQVLITGMVQKRVGTSWRTLGTKVKVVVRFKVPGKSGVYGYGSVITRTSGKFALKVRFDRSGVVSTSVITTNPRLFSSDSSWLKITVRT